MAYHEGLIKNLDNLIQTLIGLKVIPASQGDENAFQNRPSSASAYMKPIGHLSTKPSLF